MERNRKNQHIRVRVSDALREDIETAAASERRSLSNWIINVIEDHLSPGPALVAQSEADGHTTRPGASESTPARRAQTNATPARK